MRIEALAPAKLNLTLHVTGRRADGLHLLDSLVCFVSVGDRISLETGQEPGLDIHGPFADALDGGAAGQGGNLVSRALEPLQDVPPLRIRLEKNLPVAAGIGGGSSDAAAVLRAAALLPGVEMAPAEMMQRAALLGADVPVCLAGVPARMRGIGERIDPLARPLPEAWMVLANPGVRVATPAVFAALRQRENPPMPDDLPRFGDVRDLAAFIEAQRNDLEPPALALAPLIGDVLAALRAAPGCCVARMSGSGGTCFGLFDNREAAEAAALKLRSGHPDWWVKAARILGDASALEPRVTA